MFKVCSEAPWGIHEYLHFSCAVDLLASVLGLMVGHGDDPSFLNTCVSVLIRHVGHKVSRKPTYRKSHSNPQKNV